MWLVAIRNMQAVISVDPDVELKVAAHLARLRNCETDQPGKYEDRGRTLAPGSLFVDNLRIRIPIKHGRSFTDWCPGRRSLEWRDMVVRLVRRFASAT
jgi:hypothetical protein